MKKYIAPSLKIADMIMDGNILAGSKEHDYDVADVKEFKDDDLWNEEVTSEGVQSNLWDKEW